MEQSQAQGDELQIRIGIAAAPAINFIKETSPAPVPPQLSKPVANDDFTINLEAALQYDSLSRILNGYLAGKRFEISEGLINNYVVVENTAIGADTSGNFLIRVAFSGSFNGIIFFTGKPVYNVATKTVMVKNLKYDLKSKSFLLNAAKWLFDAKIVSELKKYAVFPLQTYYDTAKGALNGWLNKEWAPGVSGEGRISELTLNEVEALPVHLLIRSQCNGKLIIKISGFEL